MRIGRHAQRVPGLLREGVKANLGEGPHAGRDFTQSVRPLPQALCVEADSRESDRLSQGWRATLFLISPLLRIQSPEPQN